MRQTQSVTENAIALILRIPSSSPLSGFWKSVSDVSIADASIELYNGYRYEKVGGWVMLILFKDSSFFFI